MVTVAPAATWPSVTPEVSLRPAKSPLYELCVTVRVEVPSTVKPPDVYTP